jgi:hypothetical protein
MIHPDTSLRHIDDEIGYGVFATRLIPQGTVTWVLDPFDQVFTPDQVFSMDAIHQQLIAKYAYRDQHGHFVLCWDFGRYINHSFTSNCIATGYNFEIAVRDILPGEELTNDYGYLNLQAPFTSRVTTPTRTQVLPDDLLRHYKEWDDLVRPCLPLMFGVDQPLWSQLNAHDIDEIKETVAGKREMRSILTHYCAETG